MVSKATKISDTFTEIYNILNSNVQSVTIGSDTISLTSTDSNYWTGAYPDIEEDKKSDYPIGIIHTPDFNDAISSFRQKTSDFTIEIEVLGTRADIPPKFIEKTLDALDSNEDDLKSVGLNNFETEETRNGPPLDRGGFRVHFMLVPITLKFNWVKA